MEFTQSSMKRKSLTFQTILVVLSTMLVAMTSSSPVRHQLASSSVVASDEAWLMRSQGASKSHLVMWMMTHKQLIPRVNALVDSATRLLRCTCEEEGKSGVEECLVLAASLPNITGLNDVPSKRVIQNENKKTFVKMLLENAYTSLKELEALLWSDVTPAGLGECAGHHEARHFMDSMQTATTQYKNVITSFYKSKVAQPQTAVQIPKEEFSNDRLLATKLLYITVNHLNQVSSVLEYSVDFSWFSRMDALSNIRGKPKGAGKRKNRKTKKGRKVN